MKSYCTPEFWEGYNALPADVKKLADKAYSQWRTSSDHPGVRFTKKKDASNMWSARIGEHYRALCTRQGQDFVWFWIGSHEEYNKLV